ncbi:hypothetical protein Tco_0927277, partial [Tanacetum coccineum]
QRKGVIKDGEKRLCNVTNLNKMAGKGDTSVSNPNMRIRSIRNPNAGGYEGMASEGFEQEDYTRVSPFTAAPKDSNDNNV